MISYSKWLRSSQNRSPSFSYPLYSICNSLSSLMHKLNPPPSELNWWSCLWRCVSQRRLGAPKKAISLRLQLRCSVRWCHSDLYHCDHKHYRQDNFSAKKISCNLLPENYRDKFQATPFVIHYRFHTGTWKRQNNRLPAEILWEFILVIFDRLVTGEYCGRMTLKTVTSLN